MLERIKNEKNQEHLLNATVVDELDMGRRTVSARVTAIHIAAYNGNSGVVKLLCQEYGVDMNCGSSRTLEENPKKGLTPLEWAARKGHTVTMNNKADVNRSREGGITPLHVAADYGHTEAVELLLNHKANVNSSCTDDGYTPLHAAAWNGNTEMVKLLLNHKADVNASCTDDGFTPLLAVAWNGNAEVANLLLKNGTDVNASKHDGSTPLYIGAGKGHVELVQLLLDNKADVDACRSTDGSTPLYTALLGMDMQK